MVYCVNSTFERRASASSLKVARMKYSRDSRYRIALVSRLEAGQQNELALFPLQKETIVHVKSDLPRFNDLSSRHAYDCYFFGCH